MAVTDDDYDVVVIGGGFYGCSIAIYLARQGLRIALIERERELLQHASLVNQARLHNGYHYPRSYRTAVRSRVNLAVFREMFPETVFNRFRALYAIAEFSSKVSANHFERFCRQVDISLSPASKADVALFDRRLVQQVFEVEEPAFDAEKLRQRMVRDLAGLSVEIVKGRAVEQVDRLDDNALRVWLKDGRRIKAAWVLNCTYGDLAHTRNECRPPQRDRLGLVYQIAEVALIRPPPALSGLGVTIMDGPFFSAMPFPARGAHSLTHVQYTHHSRWSEGESTPWADVDASPTQVLKRYLALGGGRLGRSRFAYMMRDARRFLPLLNEVEHLDSLFEIKALLRRTQVDDARPILFHQERDNPHFISILGGKIDNIFDVFLFLDEALGLSSSSHQAFLPRRA